jgi:hypothetical protein
VEEAGPSVEDRQSLQIVARNPLCGRVLSP